MQFPQLGWLEVIVDGTPRWFGDEGGYWGDYRTKWMPEIFYVALAHTVGWQVGFDFGFGKMRPI
ncbi:hypothetical protein FDUTEX481_06425 [Tolypothrix sp. PCC 7601]|nr:hypothetical protein FDUTEX481_06425 [Tolypothrix sp. PCC 7601]